MTEKKRFDSYPLVMLVGGLFMFLFGYIFPPFNSVITAMGMRMLGVLIGLIIITCFNGDLLGGALMALLATVIHGYMDPIELLGTWLGSEFTVQLVFCGAICLALKESGAMNVIAKKILTSKLCKGRPVMTMVMLFLATYVVSAFLDSAPTYLLFFGLIESIRDVCGYSKKDPFIKFALLGAYIAATGVFFFPFKAPQVMTIGMINAAMEPYGRTLSGGTWMLVMFLTTMIYMVVYAVMMKTVYKLNLEPIKTLDFGKIETLRNTPDKFNKDQKAILGLLLGCIAYILFTTAYPSTAPLYDILTSLNTAWIWILGVTICALIRNKETGRSYIPITKFLTESSFWPMIALVGALVLLGKTTSDASLGIRPWLVDTLQPVFGNNNIWLLMGIVILFCTLVTQIANGLVLSLAVCPIVTPFACEMALKTSINPDVVLIISNVCSAYAFWTVASSSNAAYILGRPEIDQKFIWTKGVGQTFVFMAVTYICGMVFTFVL